MNNWYRWTVAAWLLVAITWTGILNMACNEPDPQIQTQIDGLKQDITFVKVSMDSIKAETNYRLTWFQETDSILFERIEKSEISNTEQDAELSRITGQLESWSFDSLKWFYAEMRAMGERLRNMAQVIDSLKGPIGAIDSLGNVCYTVEPDQKFTYRLRHNFLDTEGAHEWRIKFHVAVEEYQTREDLLLARDAVTHSLDYRWHEYGYDRFLELATTSDSGMVMDIPVSLELPVRGRYYVICHQAIDEAGNQSTWNRSIEEGYYVYVH